MSSFVFEPITGILVVASEGDDAGHIVRGLKAEFGYKLERTQKCAQDADARN